MPFQFLKIGQVAAAQTPAVSNALPRSLPKRMRQLPSAKKSSLMNKFRNFKLELQFLNW